MAKSKNHTNHNQSELFSVNFLCVYQFLMFFFEILDQKAHKNGIKRPKRQRSESTRGVSSFFL